MDTTQLPFQTKLSTITDALVGCGWIKDLDGVYYKGHETVEFEADFIKISLMNTIYDMTINMRMFETDQILLCLLSIGVLHHSDFDTMTSDLINKIKYG